MLANMYTLLQYHESRARFAVGIGILATALVCQAATSIVTSPDEQIVTTITDGAGALNYTVEYRGLVVIEASSLGVTVDGTNLGSGVTITGATSYSTNESFASRHGIHAVA